MNRLAVTSSVVLLLVIACEANAEQKEELPLLSNENFNADTDRDHWPDAWPKGAGITWEHEGKKAFLRLKIEKPGQTRTLFRSIKLTPDQKALKLSYRVRYEIRPGKEAWHDARIVLHRLHWTAWSFHPKASPRVLSDWEYTPTPFWGAFVRAALRGAKFEMNRMR
ncbi:MAG: hypothetical protein O3B01_29455 [Planctomycetota bacterium]|nr:hypothetical protein [Planctomycetota bacterium]MDA1142709.1 hypothetical protein [Planctomycetota bacterium]